MQCHPAVLLDFSAVLPDPSAVLPDLSAALLDLSAVLPDLSAVLPDLSAVLPDLSAVLPDLWDVLPDLWDVLPDLSAELPDRWEVLPNASAGVPEVCRGGGCGDETFGGGRRGGYRRPTMSDDGREAFLYRAETYGELRPHLDREWLLTNGTGGFAAGTVVGCNARRYHGLLCAATLPPVGRIMALSRLAERVQMLDGNPYKPAVELDLNRFGDDLSPRGDRYLRHFRLGDTVRWQYDAAGVLVTKELQLAWGQDGCRVRYHVDPTARGRVRFTIAPFAALRDFHALRHAHDAELTADGSGQGQVVVRCGQLALTLAADGPGGLRFEAEPDWWYGHTYPTESARGLDDSEDLFTPGRFEVELDGPATVELAAWLGEDRPAAWDEALARRRERRAPPRPVPTIAQKRLSHAAADFVVRRSRPDGRGQATSILAGYPWFADWGRDTMIALPGLLLSTGRHHQAGQVLSLFAEYVDGGMIPNRFDDYTNEPSYNTVDASLWFVHAAFAYRRASRDEETFESILRPACRAIIDGYRAGTRWRIGVDDADGLVTAGDADTQLTWMDAKVGDEAFTPRHGKAVEINALWYNALRLMGEDDAADRHAQSFVDAFWLAPHKGLADCVRGGPGGYERDEQIRPNQIFAAGLPHSPLDQEQKRAVVARVRRHLLTPMGLRSLSPQDAQYAPEYRGDMYARDKAYHNGTVWAWLIGAFLDAHLAAEGRSQEAVEQCRAWLAPLIGHLEDGCVGQLAEVFDADSPHKPQGCPAQAWSVAEVLRLAVELDL